MAALHNVGADAPGQSAPERSTNDEPRELAGNAGSKGKDRRVSLDCAGNRHGWQSVLPELCLTVWSVALALALLFGGRP